MARDRELNPKAKIRFSYYMYPFVDFPCRQYGDFPSKTTLAFLILFLNKSFYAAITRITFGINSSEDFLLSLHFIIDRDFFSFICFLENQRSIFHNFFLCCPSQRSARGRVPSQVATHQEMEISCGLGKRRIRTQDCRTTVWRTTIEPPHLPPLSHNASQH
jgi:hypothetical protein